MSQIEPRSAHDAMCQLAVSLPNRLEAYLSEHPHRRQTIIHALAGALAATDDFFSHHVEFLGWRRMAINTLRHYEGLVDGTDETWPNYLLPPLNRMVADLPANAFLGRPGALDVAASHDLQTVIEMMVREAIVQRFREDGLDLLNRPGETAGMVLSMESHRVLSILVAWVYCYLANRPEATADEQDHAYYESIIYHAYVQRYRGKVEDCDPCEDEEDEEDEETTP